MEDWMLCPIGLTIMVDPVVAADRYTYERYNIESWFKINNTSPMTNNVLISKVLYPNLLVKQLIAKYAEENNIILHSIAVDYEKKRNELCKAAANGDTERVISLSLEGGYIERYGNNALACAVGMNRIECARILIAAGADVNGESDGITHLKTASQDGLGEMVSLLIKSGVNVGDGLYWAVFYNQYWSIKIYVNTGLGIDYRDEQNNTPLHAAVYMNADMGVYALLEPGSNTHTNKYTVIDAIINAQNNNGWTALHYAVSSDYVHYAKQLIKKGADFHIKDNENKSPYDIATGRCKEYFDNILMIF